MLSLARTETGEPPTWWAWLISTDAPWWALLLAPLIASLFTFLLTRRAARVDEERRFAREDARLFLERKLVACADLSDALFEAQKAQLEERWPAFGEANQAAYRAYHVIGLLCSESVQRAANAAIEASMRSDRESWKATGDAFAAAARQELT